VKKSNRQFSQRIEKRFPEFEKGWKKLVREVGAEMVNFLKERISNEYDFFKELTSFKLKLVIDNNFIFGQIKGSIKKKESIEKSLLYKLLISKSVEIFAPPRLNEELHDKINKVIDQEDQEVALSYAMILLPRITIKDAQWVDEWKKANRLIGEVDKDDVPYLALALEIGSHAIVSFDDVFHRQGEIQVWKHHETDKIVTSYNSGFISFCLMGNIGDALARLISVVFRFIRDSILKLVEILAQIAKGIVTGIAKLPPAILILLVALGIIFFEDLKRAGKDLFNFIKEKGSEILARLKVATKEILDIIRKVIEIGKLGATIAFEFLGFLVDEYNGLNNQLENLKLTNQFDTSAS
jgi:predicted nucleic acid-binding protein